MAGSPEPLPDRPHIPPLPVDQWDKSTFAAFEPMRPPEGSAYAQRKAERKQGGAGTAGVFGVLARHPDLTLAWHQFNRHILYFSTLDERTRELLVLRIGYLRQCAYEWAQHVEAARSMGMDDDEIAAVAIGSEDPRWATHDAAVLRAVDELHGDGVISAPTWRTLSERFDERQLMDLVFTVGAYDVLALAFNTFGIRPDPDIAGITLPPRER